jgi:hypothetical protein
MFRHAILGALSVVITLGLVGCAGNADDAAADEGNFTAQEPITLENFIQHPRIKEIRDIVVKVEDAKLPSKDNPGCDGSTTKFTDPQGRIRKLFEIGGESSTLGQTTKYYDEAGKLRFVFIEVSDLEATAPTQRRIYLDENSKVIWEVIRFGVFNQKTPDDLSTNFSKAVDQVPQDGAPFEPSEVDLDPAKGFAVTGCPENP